MKLPKWRSREQISERRHYDPPALWYAVILGSFAIHLSAFGMIQWLGIGGLIGRNSANELIPIDVVAAPTSPLPPKTNSTPIQKPIKKGNQTPPKTSPTPSPKGIKPQPSVKKTPVSTNKKNPTSNSNKPSVPVQPKTKPTPTGKNNHSTTTPNPPSPSPNSSPAKPSPSPQSEGGITVFPGKLLRKQVTGDIQLPGDSEPAILVDSSKQLSPKKLKQFGVSLERDLELKVGIIVETDGTASVELTQVEVVRGSISQDQAYELAYAIIPKWRFKPTQTPNGPIVGNYTLPLTIRAASK